MQAKINGRTYKELEGYASCSCCGLEPDDKWAVFRAGLVDEDGEYFARLCGHRGTGRNGCLEDLAKVPVKNRKYQREAALLMALMPEEADDGIVTLMEDIRDGWFPSLEED